VCCTIQSRDQCDRYALQSVGTVGVGRCMLWIRHLLHVPVLCVRLQCSGSQIDCSAYFHDKLHYGKANGADDKEKANSVFRPKFCTVFSASGYSSPLAIQLEHRGDLCRKVPLSVQRTANMKTSHFSNAPV
jgi:hypothetical protein